MLCKLMACGCFALAGSMAAAQNAQSSDKPQFGAWGLDIGAMDNQVLPGNDSFRQSLDALLRDRFVLGSPEECWEQLRPCWEEAGANFLIFRTHWSGMPVGHALSSMRLISDELLPALRRVSPATPAG